MGDWDKQASSRLGRSIVSSLTSTNSTVTAFTTPFSSQVRQIRVAHNLATGIWMSVGLSSSSGTNPTVTAASSQSHYVPPAWVEYFTCNPGQAVAYISTSTSSGYIGITEMV